MPRPDATEYAEYHAKYVAMAPGDDPFAALETGREALVSLLRGLPEDVAETVHAPYTWSVKEVLGHMIDCERIHAYRALRVARGDETRLPGFDENLYVANACFDARSLDDLLDEYEAARGSHLALFRGFPEAAWDRRGMANDVVVSVRGWAFIIAGHEQHHIAILRERLGRG